MADVWHGWAGAATARRLRLAVLGATILAVVALGAVVGWAGTRDGPAPSAAEVPAGTRPEPEQNLREPTFSRQQWSTDFSRSTVPLGEIESGGPPKDGIPPIDHPQFVTTAEASASLAADEPVMVVRRGSDARAYPLQILIWHEIVNDTVGGEPVVVTYCPLCNTALALRRTFEGQVLDFGTTGNLRHSDLVMYDRQTESWWQQATGEGIVGTFAGKRLEFVPASIVAYGDFKTAYPEGRVLSPPAGSRRPYGTNPYVEYDSGSPFLFAGRVDGRLHATERVVAVVLDGQAVAYPFPVLARERVVNDQAGGTPLVVLFKPGTRSALDADVIRESREVGAGVVFGRRVEGRTLTFRADGDGPVDIETGSRWDITGRAVSGPLAGAQLEPLVHGNHFWFAWAVFRPETRVYGVQS